MARIGLVLGAGGVTGGAFHAGVLAALSEVLGWDPRTAEIVVGTSAGSITAAMLRAGLPAVDLAARSEGRPLSTEGSRLFATAGLSGGAGSEPPLQARRPGARSRPAAPSALLAAARRPWTVRPRALIAALLPEGTVPTASIADSVAAFAGPGWPARQLWVCAVRLDDGELVVFGRPEAPPAGVGEAVAASCAIPGFFTPVAIDGVRYVDGGVSSLTNLSLVAGMNLDLVVVSAPMSSAGHRVPLAGRALARQAGRAQLDREALRVRRRGTPVIAFHPTAEDQAVMGVNAMDTRRRVAVVRQARESTIRRLERADVRRRLSSLTDG
jgi:NTE family protein